QSRPYQGVRVRDPVKELLRRKRGLETPNSKTAPPTAVRAPSQSNLYHIFHWLSSAATSDGGLQCPGWKAPPPATSTALSPADTQWPSTDYTQQDPSAQTLAYPAPPTLTADVYMQTLCPSYTMLTYTHTPLFSNFGVTPASLPQVELPDSGLTYLPWAQPLTTISTMSSPGVQFAPGSAALSGSPLVHMPLPMSLATMIPQLEFQGTDTQPQVLDHQLGPESESQALDEDPDVEQESPNLLDKLLEDQKEDDGEEAKDSYSSSLFIEDV
uniref:OCA domain-containing protein n=1 Tax=Sphaeramia orbicularis TaxID=375764 RepID=A0A673C057_9TELE